MATVATPADNPRWPLEQSVLSTAIPPRAKLLMLTLLTYTSRTTGLDLGKFSPGMRELTGRTGMAVNTVTSYVRQLERHGWLTRTRDGEGQKFRYVLSRGRSFGTTEASHPAATPKVTQLGESPQPEATQQTETPGVSPDCDGGVSPDCDGGVSVADELPAQTPDTYLETIQTEGQTAVQDHFGFANGRASEDSALASDDSPAKPDTSWIVFSDQAPAQVQAPAPAVPDQVPVQDHTEPEQPEPRRSRFDQMLSGDYERPRSPLDEALDRHLAERWREASGEPPAPEPPAPEPQQPEPQQPEPQQPEFPAPERRVSRWDELLAFGT